MVLTCMVGMSATASAEEMVVIGDIYQWTNGNVTATLNGTTLTVAKTEDAENGIMGSGWEFVGDAPDWEYERGTITDIIIEDGVTSIGAFAFSDCSSLKSVTIPSGVTSIDNFAFNC